MRTMFVLAVIAFIATAAGIIWYVVRRWKEKQYAEAQRVASFLAATAGRPMMAALPEAPTRPAPPVMSPIGDIILPQKLLFEAAHKAGEAGEPALAIQLYARLLTRFPQTAFADQARAAVEAQKKKIAKA
jgi:hypothetical protein